MEETEITSEMIDIVCSTNENTEDSKEKRIVYVRTVFLKIGEIDTVKENFSAEILVEARWREPLLDRLKFTQDNAEIKWEDYWNPKIFVGNGVGELKEVVTYDVLRNNLDQATVLESKKIKGCFVENLELWNFPFDAQDLSISIVSNKTAEEVELTQDLINGSSINKFVFVDEQEWELYSFVHSIKKTIQMSNEKSEQTDHYSIEFFCKAVRRSGFFVWNTFVVLFLICAMTFTTFAVVYTKPENRLQLTFILLLTTVAFRSNVNSTLPKISYLTLMDKYIIYSMAIQCIVCVWHAIVGGALHCVTPCVLTVSDITTFWADKIVFIVLISLYFISVFVFVIYVYYGIYKNHKKSSRNDLLRGASKKFK